MQKGYKLSSIESFESISTDSRGSYEKFFSKDILEKLGATNFEVAEISVVKSLKGSKRGFKNEKQNCAKIFYLLDGSFTFEIANAFNSEEKVRETMHPNQILFLEQDYFIGNTFDEDSLFVYATAKYQS